jgi:Flp pilus assembly protein TadG
MSSRLARQGGAVLRRLLHDSSGAAVLEFAITMPVWILLTMGTLDLGQLAYAKSVLAGATRDAARSSSLEAGDTDEADVMVQTLVGKIAPGATVTASRVSYFDFADIGRAESWTDSDSNGTCNNGEPYIDENGNDQWDEDIGASNNGGANDVVIYTVTVEFERLFKFPLTPGEDTRSISSTAVRKNQPFANQEGYNTTGGGTCD